MFSWKMQFIHVSLKLKIYCSLFNCDKNLKSSNGGRTTYNWADKK